MCILRGFPSGSAKNDATFFPFGIWLADTNTLYVANEGDEYAGGLDLCSHASAEAATGLQNWVFGTPVAGQWNYVYTPNAGLDLGVPSLPQVSR